MVSSWPADLLQISPGPRPDGEDEDFGNVSEYSTTQSATTEVKSGTSFATPIAASIAAFLLRFARTHLDANHAEQLTKHSVMRSVLKCLAGPKRQKFYYLTLRHDPEHLFGQSLDGIKWSIKKAIQESG